MYGFQPRRRHLCRAGWYFCLTSRPSHSGQVEGWGSENMHATSHLWPQVPQAYSRTGIAFSKKVFH